MKEVLSFLYDRKNTTLIGMIGPVIFVLVFLVLGFLKSDYDPKTQFISELSLGPTGFIQMTNFVFMGIVLLIFALGVRRIFENGKASKAGPILFTIISVGFILGGIFVTDPYTLTSTFNNQSTHSLIHTISGAIVFLLMPITCFVYYRRFLVDLEWNSLKTFTIISGVILTLCFIGINLGRDVHVVGGFNIFEWKGLIQRIDFITFMVWIFLFSYKIRKISINK